MSPDPLLDAPMLTPETAGEAGRALLEQAQAKLGFIPNMYRHMVHEPALLRAYLDAYDAFRRDTGFTPSEQETVLLAISHANGCDYCVAAHSMIAEKKSGVPAEALAALREGAAPADARLGALARFTRIMVETRGRPEKGDVDAFLAAGLEPRHVFGIVLPLGVKTYSNYANHLTETALDAPFEGYAVG